MKNPIKELIKNRTGIDLSEKGFVLILALVVMLAMTIIGISLVMNMSTDMHLASNERESKQAFQLAEAGINETIARLRLPAVNAKYVGEPAAAAGTYRTVAGWAGTTYNSTTSADGLDYSVTVAYLTEQEIFRDSAANSAAAAKNTSAGNGADGMPLDAGFNNEVVMYGRDFNICSSALPCTRPSARIGTYPVYRIISTGTVNTTDRSIEAYVGASDLNIDTLGAINTNGCILDCGPSCDITGGVAQGGACDTVCGAGELEGVAAADCDAALLPKPALDDMLTFLTGGALDELSSTADYQIDCASVPACNADIGAVPDDMWGTCSPGDPSGGVSKLVYIQTGAISPAISGSDLGAGGCGKGILIVDGDVEFAGGFAWEGLIYVIGTLTLNGGGGALNITGGIMANDTVNINGGIVADYDQATLQEVGRQVGSGAKTFISWKRI